MARTKKTDTSAERAISSDDCNIDYDANHNINSDAGHDGVNDDSNAGSETESETGNGIGDGIENGNGNPLEGIAQVSSKRISKSGRQSGDDGGGSGSIRRKTSGKSSQAILKTAGNKALAQQIVGAHAVLGVLSGHPEICNISDEEGEALVEAVTNVLAQYKIKPNPKVAAWISLAGVAMIVYAPKVFEARKLIKTNSVPKQRNDNPDQSIQSVVRPLSFG